MKKILLVLLLSSISSLNAMSRFLARNSTDYTVTLAGKTLQPHEQIALQLPYDDVLTVEAENNGATRIRAEVGWHTKLFDITKRENSDSHIHTHQLVVTKKQTRPLIIIKKYHSPLLVTEVNNNLLACKDIPCHEGFDDVSADIAANTEQVEIQYAQPAETYRPNTPNDLIALVPRKDRNPRVVTLARNATGLQISPDEFGRLKITQLKHVEIIRGIKESE